MRLCKLFARVSLSRQFVPPPPPPNTKLRLTVQKVLLHLNTNWHPTTYNNVYLLSFMHLFAQISTCLKDGDLAINIFITQLLIASVSPNVHKFILYNSSLYANVWINGFWTAHVLREKEHLIIKKPGSSLNLEVNQYKMRPKWDQDLPLDLESLAPFPFACNNIPDPTCN